MKTLQEKPMKNEPKEIYLVCFSLSETNPDYLHEDNDFETLEHEFVTWSHDDISGMKTIKYMHQDEVKSALQPFIDSREKVRSTLLMLMARPDNEPDSEFADRISDLESIVDLIDKAKGVSYE